MEFRIKQITTSEIPLFIPEYRYNNVSDWKVFPDSVFRTGYTNHTALADSQLFIEKVKKIQIEVYTYCGEN